MFYITILLYSQSFKGFVPILPFFRIALICPEGFMAQENHLIHSTLEHNIFSTEITYANNK